MYKFMTFRPICRKFGSFIRNVCLKMKITYNQCLYVTVESV